MTPFGLRRQTGVNNGDYIKLLSKINYFFFRLKKYFFFPIDTREITNILHPLFLHSKCFNNMLSLKFLSYISLPFPNHLSVFLE